MRLAAVIGFVLTLQCSTLAQGQGNKLVVPEGRSLEADTAEVAGAIRGCVVKRWKAPKPKGGAVVKVRLSFSPDGRLSVPPEIVNSSGAPEFQKLAESAIKAIHACSPFKLSAETYYVWKKVILNFDPRDVP